VSVPKRVGYLGVGNIGEVIAGNALGAGFELMVYDLRAEPLERLRARGAKVAPSARELGAHAEVLQVSIAGDARIENALCAPDGALAGMAAGSVIALHSTMAPATVRRIHERARAAGVEVVDAQVTGGSRGAESRTLCMMVGGDPAVVERCRPLFAASCDRIYHMGAIGAGAGAKIAQQMMTVMNLAGVAEALRVAAAAGLDRERFLEMVAHSTGQSYAADTWLARWAGLPQAQADGLYDGMLPALALAREAGVAVPLTAVAQQLIRTAFAD